MTTINNEFRALDSTKWQASNWANGGTFLNSWGQDQVVVNNGQLIITLESISLGLATYVSGEYRTLNKYRYGYYEIVMTTSAAAGTVTGFFTYTGVSKGTRHDEIDVEILGDDPTVMQVNYWTNGVQHPTNINLGFNASSAAHVYAFEWQDDSIKWYVDRTLVHTENGSRGELPTVPGEIMLNLWATTNTGGWSSDAYTGQATSLNADYITHLAYEKVVTPNAQGRSMGSEANELLGRNDSASVDRMAGGNGDDIYVIDNKSDRITEKYGEGNDEVRASVSYTLGKNVENLTLTGTPESNLSGTGNQLANVLTGDGGANILDGGIGLDTYSGGKGDDTYLVNEPNENGITEYAGEGRDIIRLRSNSTGSYTLADNVENLMLTGAGQINVTGNAGDNEIAGNAKANMLNGGAGGDLLSGGRGNDTLTGGSGVDTFAFDTRPARSNVDTINDFISGTDKIRLDTKIFTKLVGAIDLNLNFETITTDDKATDANHYLLYDAGTGSLYYDADGAGSSVAVLVAVLADGAGNSPTLTASDLFVV